VDIFAEYVGKVSFLDISSLEKMGPGLEIPAPAFQDSAKTLRVIVVAESVAIAALVIFILWLLHQKKGKR
jgi:hypothetical protein